MPFEELKARQSVMWGSGRFEEIEELIADMHDALVGALEPRPGERWLDVGTGTGAIAMRAARAGAEVTALDFAPALVETARRRCGAEGLAVACEVGDAEHLPYQDASFDVVSSSVGCMFAPDHAAVARELARVCRPGGRLGLTAWRPEGGVGAMFEMIAPFQPAPPPGAGDPLDWGRTDRVHELLAGPFELAFRELDSPYAPESGEASWRQFSTAFGPTKTLADSLDDERRAEFHRAWVEFFERYRVDGGIRQPREYLLVLGRRR